MTRRRSSPLGLELVLSVVLALVVLPLLSHGAPVQESHGDLQRYSEGCYYNYNHYSEGDRILTNEPCLNCTCHNKMLMCYLRVCPFTKPIGHDCTVEKREDQCCPIVTCPEVPVDIAHHSHQLTTSAPGTELSIPEKYGCSIDNKFYVEGAQVPSNPNKPCELCYCIRNRTACLMQECTLHIDGCQPIYNKGSCCPVRYNCDHENELLEIEDFSTTTTTIRPTEGYLLPSTTSPSVTTDCIHNNEVYADGASITGKSSCEHCYCMRGDIVCAVQECEMPTLESGAKTCRALPPAAGECCPSNYECDDDSVTTEGALAEDIPTTITPIIQTNLHESVSQEDVQLQEHIDDKIPVTEVPEDSDEQQVVQKDEIAPTTISPIAGEVSQPAEQENEDSEVNEEKPISTTISAIKETGFETTQSPTEHSTTHKTEEGFGSSHEDKEDESVHPPKEDEIINEATTVSPVVGDIQKTDSEKEQVLPTEKLDSEAEEETTDHSLGGDGLKTEEEKETLPFKEEDIKPDQFESTSTPEESTEKDDASTDIKKPDVESVTIIAPADDSEDVAKPATETVQSTDAALENVTPEIFVPSKDHIEPEVILSGETEEKDESSTELPSEISKPETENVVSSTLASVEESDDVNKMSATEVTPKFDNASEFADAVTTVSSKPLDEPEEASSESTEFSEESAPGQQESQDKIDENISEPHADTSTSSPIYETITEGDNSLIGMPEAGDHKTESDLPKKKPKDEPESMEEIPVSSDVTTDGIPQGIIDGITEHIVELSTSTPSSDGGDSTTKSSVLQDNETLDESTQGTVEDKPVQEDVEIPAVVEEITVASSTTSKPVSGDIAEEDDKPSPTTVLPVKDTNADEGTESQEEELSTGPSDTETTNRPIRIHTDGEEELSEITTKGTEEELVDLATSLPPTDDTSAAITEKEEEDKQVSSVPSVIDSEEPSTEGVLIEKDEDATVKAPSVEDDALPIVEEGAVKPEKETDESSTIMPSKISEPEPESETNLPIDLETTSKREEEIEGKPHSDEKDFTTTIPLIDDSGKEHDVEAEPDKIQPEQDIQSTYVPTISVEEEEQKKQTEQSLSDSTTKHPSVNESEETSIEENETKTETPVHVESGETSVEEDNTQRDPELNATSTVAPSKPSDDSSNKEGIEGELEPGTSDSTTISPNAIDSEISSAEGDTQKTPEHEMKTSDDKTPTEILSDSGTTELLPSEEGDSDSTVTPPLIPDESESTDEHKTPASDENIAHTPSAQDISDSSTVVPSVIVSEEEVKQETENILSDLTTVSPSTSDIDRSTDKEIKIQTEEELIDSSTIISISTSPEVQPATTSPSLVESESQEKDEDIETSEDGSSSGTPSPVDSETLEQATDASIPAIAGDIPSPTTAVPQPIEAEEPIKEATHDEHPIDDTSLAPIAHSDKESVDTTEESYVPMHDIIPSAIPGEGDCLANGKTFANNATVPTSSECEVSCTCISSIIVCKKVQCYEPPQPNNCVPDEASTDKCCPQYICGIDSFEKDQRPTTPEEVEDGEIQFTTFTPSTKYPDVSYESTTHKTEHDEPIKHDESSETELPAFSDENTTPVSMDFEQPALTPEDPLSHVKVDETEESSTKHSDEDISVEESATTIQPITAKPTKQVTGDIEQPIEVTSVKPVEITTPRATYDEDEEKSTTPTPTSDDLPSSSDSVDEPKEPVVPGEGFSTEGTLEKEVTTLQPIKLDVSSERPSAPEVIQTDDSTQSEEIPETSDENSNESGEETNSEEETKSPLLHKEDEQKITTSRPLVSEHIGDIEPLDESTRIPEIDYSKPEMPEDLSHTKVEDESPIATEKPVKDDVTGELEENEEATEKTITTPASTILTRVEPTEDDVHKIDTTAEISDKKDDIPSLESEEDKPIHSTIAPVKSEEEPISETVTESKKDEIEGHIDLPKPVSEEDTDLESHQTPSETVAPTHDEEKPFDGIITAEADATSDDIIPSTSSPATEDHSIEGSGENVSEEDSGDKQHELATSTIDQTLTPVASDESSEENDKTPIDTIATAVDDLHTPIDSENAIKNEEIPSQTSVPPKEEQSFEGSGAPISEGKPTVEQNEIADQTSAPAIEKQPSTSDSEEENEIDVTTFPTAADHTVEGSGVPALGDKSEQDEIVSQTSVPHTDEQPSTSDSEEDVKIDVPTSAVVEGTGAPVTEDKIDVPQDEITSQTTVTTVEKQTTLADLDEQNKIDVTSSPIVEEGSGSPISEDKTDVELEETVEQTSSPAAEKQPSPIDFEEQNKIDATSSPTTDEDAVEGSGAPVLEDKTDVEEDEFAKPTTIPATEEQPSISDLEEEIKIAVTSPPDVEEGSGAPISEDKTDIEQDELASQTSAPTVDSQSAVTDTNKLEDQPIEESGPTNAEEDSIHEQQMDTQTRVPLTEDEVTIAPISGHDVHLTTPTIAPVLDLESNEVISSQTNPPTVTSEESDEDKTSVESQTDVPSHELNDTSVPQTTEKESHDSTLPSQEGEDIVSETVAPIVGDKYEESDLPEDQKPTVSVPISEEDKESETTTISSNVKGEGFEVSEGPEGSAPTKDMEMNDPSKDASLSNDEYVGATENAATSAPVQTSDEDTSETEAPSKDTSSEVSSDENIEVTESSAVSTPAKTIEEEKESTEDDKTSSTILPVKAVDVESDVLASTELPSTSTPSKPIENIDEVTVTPQVDSGKVQTSEETSSAESEPAVTVSTSNMDGEVFGHTEATLVPDSNASNEDSSVQQTEEQSSGEKEVTDKTLITTESSPSVSETVVPSVGIDNEENIDQVHTDKPSTQTKQPELVDEETSTKAKDEIESIVSTEMPGIISSHEVTQQPGKLESDDQILIEDNATVKPSADDTPAQTESSADVIKPSLEESQTTTKLPAVIDASETNEQPDKPDSVEEDSAEDIEKKPSLDESQTTTKVPAVIDASETNEQPEKPEVVENESPEDTESKTPQPVAQTVSPVVVGSEQDVSSEDVDTFPTEKPIDNSAATGSQEEDVVTEATTNKTSENFAPTKSEEQGDVKVSSTVAPVDEESITSSPIDAHADSDVTYSTEKSDDGKEQTPKDDTKVQTIEEFVTERAEDITTALPSEDKEHIPEETISQDLPQQPSSTTDKQEGETLEVSTPSESDESEENVQITEVPAETSDKDTKPHVVPTSLPESEEKVQVTEVPAEISADESKPQVHPTSSVEESDEKTEVPEITPDISEQPGTGAISESEEKTQAPETQPEITEEDHKQHIQPTEGAIASSTSDKPIEPTADDKIDSDLPQPIVQDELPSSEEDTPLSTTIHPLFPHIELDRTTSIPLNATDKDSSLPYIPTTEQPASQAITNAPTTQYQPPGPGYGQVPPQYPSYTEDEYTDEDETEVFGPGTCRYGGKLFVSAQQIPRDDPCDFCFCFRSDIICLQQSCPPPISGCHEEPISGFCCPRYECPVSMATTLNITTSTTTTSTTLPPHFLHHAYRGAAAKTGCHISGKSYKVGDKIDSASGPCMHCTCGGDGQMKCDPKTCSPEPMLRQMIAVVASRRR